MKQSLPISHVAEQVCEYLYNMNIFGQIEILQNNFDVDIEDTDNGIVWEEDLITDSQFDSYFTDIIENMSEGTIIDLWGDIVNYECELDEDNNVVWEDDE